MEFEEWIESERFLKLLSDEGKLRLKYGYDAGTRNERERIVTEINKMVEEHQRVADNGYEGCIRIDIMNEIVKDIVDR